MAFFFLSRKRRTCLPMHKYMHGCMHVPYVRMYVGIYVYTYGGRYDE